VAREASLASTPAKLIFIDEDVGPRRTMTRTARARAPDGRAAGRSRPARTAGRTTTLIAALGRSRHAVLDDARTARSTATQSEAFVATILAPTLAVGDVVVMDNLSSHKGAPRRVS